MHRGTATAAPLRLVRWAALVGCVGLAFGPAKGPLTVSAAFQARDWTQLRRETIEDAVAGRDPTTVVEWAVRGRPEASTYLAIRILGRKALPHLYEILADDQYRGAALGGILLVIDPTDPRALEDLKRAAARAETKDDWAELRALREVIDISQLNSAEQRDARLDELQRKFPPGDGLSPQRLALMFPSTQGWALRRAQALIKEQAAVVRNEQVTPELDMLFVDLPGAAAVPHMEAANRKLLVELLSQLRHVQHKAGINETDTYIALAQYLASGRDLKALDQALEMAGDDDHYGSRPQAASIYLFGDTFFGPEDVALLIRRATDAGAPATIRVGAIRLLSYAASADARFLRVRKELAESTDRKVRDAAKQAAVFVIDGERETPGL